MRPSTATIPLIVAAALVSWIAALPQDSFDPEAPGSEAEPVSAAQAGEIAVDGMTWVRGMELPVGLARPLQGAKQRTSLVDTYLDWDYGAVTYHGADGSIAAVPAPKNWLLRHIQLPNGGGVVALCFQPGTGLSFLLDGDGEWKPLSEPSDEVVVGDYDVTLAIDSERVYAMRFDQFSGRSWTLGESGWEPIRGNLDGWPVAAQEEGR